MKPIELTCYNEFRKREEQLEDLIGNLPGGVQQCAYDKDLTLLDVSTGFLKMFGYTRSELKELFDDKYMNMIHPEESKELLRQAEEQLSGGATERELEYRVLCKDGSYSWILDKGRLLQKENGEKILYCILVDITLRKNAQEQLRLSLEKHKVIMDQTTDIIFEWDICSDSLEFSANWEKKFGYRAIDQNVSNAIAVSENIHIDDRENFIQIVKACKGGTPYCETEFRIRNHSGLYLWNRVRATVQYDSKGKAIKAVGVIIDISEEKNARQRLLELAQKDTLTGLYNKGTIRELAEEKMRSKISGMHAMLIIDVDDFKNVNDTYGHLCGDTLLSDIAQILKKQFRSSDLIGRIGGDEFLVYLPEVTGEQAVRMKSEILLRKLGTLQPCEGAEPVSCSIGVVTCPQTQSDYLYFYKCADEALYYKKSRGKGGLAFYGPEVAQKTGINPVEEKYNGRLRRSAVNEVIDFEDRNVLDEKLAQYTFRILYHSTDIPEAINKILEIVGRSYAAARVYIFENSEDGTTCSNTFEWCASDVEPQADRYKLVSYETEMYSYLDNFNAEGIFICRDISKLPPNLSEAFAAQGTRFILQCAILDHNKFKGFIGFDENSMSPGYTNAQIASLNLIANVLSVFLVRQRMEEKIKVQSECETIRLSHDKHKDSHTF